MAKRNQTMGDWAEVYHTRQLTRFPFWFKGGSQQCHDELKARFGGPRDFNITDQAPWDFAYGTFYFNDELVATEMKLKFG